jgi:multidrug resistance efflux pump
MPGYISEVPINDNQSVKAGEVIARIDPHSRCWPSHIDKYV